MDFDATIQEAEKVERTLLSRYRSEKREYRRKMMTRMIELARKGDDPTTAERAALLEYLDDEGALDAMAQEFEQAQDRLRYLRSGKAQQTGLEEHNTTMVRVMTETLNPVSIQLAELEARVGALERGTNADVSGEPHCDPD